MATASRERHFVVSASGPFDLVSILAKLAPGDTEALNQGRIFVDGKRAEPSVRRVAAGARVTWVSARSNSRSDLDFEILAREEELLVVSKPAGWSSEPDRTGNLTSLRERISEKLGVRSVHVATRLDAGVSGLVLVALSDAACRLSSRLQSAGQLQKTYLALAIGRIDTDVEWNQPIGGSEARSSCHPLAHSGLVRFSTKVVSCASLLRVAAVTGRHHQIRVHAASNGTPLLGDRRYGGPTRYVASNGAVHALSRPMLHAWKLEIRLPSRIWTTFSDTPTDMRELWRDVGGADVWPAACVD